MHSPIVHNQKYRATVQHLSNGCQDVYHQEFEERMREYISHRPFKG